MQRLFFALCATFFSIISIQSSVAEPIIAQPIEVVTVSATPIRIDGAGSAVSIITRDDIRNRGSASLQALLREVPGFSVSQQGSEGAITQLRVRGAEANQVLVLINGVEVNDPAQGSEFDFSQVALGDVERIEIVRGPQSALWGSDAMAGVIHIITRPDADASSFEASMEAGSFGTSRAALLATYASPQHSVRFSADYLDTDGTNISRAGSEEDGLDNLTLGIAGRYTASDDLAINYSVRHTDKTSEFDAVDFFTTGLPTDADYETESEYLYAGVTVTHTISEQFDHSISLARTDTDNETFSGGPVHDITRATRDALRYQFNIAGDNNRFSVLAERETEDYQQRGATSFFGDPNKNLDTDTNSIAAEYRYDSDNFHFSLSARQDDNSDYDDADSWRMTGNYKFGETTLYASIGESIKNPTFTERFGFFTNFIGNPDLDPEESLHWEIGARRAFADNRLNASMTYFRANLENEINGFVFDAATGGFTSANVDGESDREGVELELAYNATERLDIRASYTWLDATQEDFTGSDVTEVRRPEHTGSVSMNYRWNSAGLNLAVSYTGTQEDDFFPPYPPFLERVELDAYTLVSLSGYYDVNDSVTLTARLENTTDESYEQVFGFESPGAAGYLGFRLKW